MNVGGNLGYQRGPLAFFGSYGFLRDRRPRNEAVFRENTYLTPVTYLDETARRMQEPLAHTLTAELEYKPAKQDEFSLDDALQHAATGRVVQHCSTAIWTARES